MRLQRSFIIVSCLSIILAGCWTQSSLSVPKGKILFAFPTNYPTTNYDIYVINTNGSWLNRLTWSIYDDAEPAWSPSGEEIIFTTNRDSYTKRLYVMKADGGQQQALIVNVTEELYSGASPDWSSDGTQIAFLRPNSIAIYILEDGTLTNIKNNSKRDYSPKWSPDNTEIMFSSLRDDESYQIFIMNVDGSNLRPVSYSSGSQILLDWSPNGEWVVFQQGGLEKNGIYLMKPDGTGQRFLTDECQDASFSPDSQWLALSCMSIDPIGIYIMNLEKGVLKNITGDIQVQEIGYVAWSP